MLEVSFREQAVCLRSGHAVAAGSESGADWYVQAVSDKASCNTKFSEIHVLLRVVSVNIANRRASA